MVEKVVNAGYNSLERIRNATVYDLARVELFGATTANQFHKEFHALYFDIQKALENNEIKFLEYYIIKTISKLLLMNIQFLLYPLFFPEL